MTHPPAPGPWRGQPPQNTPWNQHPAPPHGQWRPPQQPPVDPGPPRRRWWKPIAFIAALVAVAAISVTATTMWNRHEAAGPTGSPQPATDIASANDTGPVGLITDDPSCAAWGPVATTLSAVEDKGWKQRDPNVPASAWTPETRAQFLAAAEGMRNAADQAVPLAKVTTHRVMRELYLAFIAYHRAYADRVPAYVPADNALAQVAADVGGIINGVCGSITSGAAAARTVLVPAAAAPNAIAPLGNPVHPEKFMTTPIDQCAQWKTAQETMNTNPEYRAWVKIDPSLPAASWSPENKAANDTIKPVLSAYADTMEHLGRQSTPNVEDFAVLGAQYARAFVAAIPTYTQADEPLYDVERLTAPLITSACRAVS